MQKNSLTMTLNIQHLSANKWLLKFKLKMLLLVDLLTGATGLKGERGLNGSKGEKG